jgi:MFS family permease
VSIAPDQSRRLPGTEGASSERRDFALLWTGQSVSLLGDNAMVLALPLLAASVLGASPAQAALLPFALYLPFLLIGLPAGALIDRFRRRPTLIIADLVQAASFLAIAALAVIGALPFPILLLLVGVAGTAGVFFQIAYTSYLPSLLAHEHDLQRGNARLFLSESLARTAGPPATGPLIAAFGPIVAVAINATSSLLSVVSLTMIRHRELGGAAPRREPGWLAREIREGVGFVAGHPLLAPVIACGGVYVLFLSMVEASLVLYGRDVLGLSATGVGVVVGAAAIGFPVGNLVSTRAVARFGTAPTLVIGATVSVLGLVAMPLAGSVGSVAGLVAAGVVHGVGEGAFGPAALTLRQTVTPAALLGRVNAVQRWVIWGAIPLGSLLAALTIHVAGLSAALWVGGVGTVACLPVLLRHGIRDALRPVAGGVR